MPHEDAIYPTTKLSKIQPGGADRNLRQTCLKFRSCGCDFLSQQRLANFISNQIHTRLTVWGRTKWERANLLLSKLIVNTTDEKMHSLSINLGAWLPARKPTA